MGGGNLWEAGITCAQRSLLKCNFDTLPSFQCSSPWRKQPMEGCMDRRSFLVGGAFSVAGAAAAPAYAQYVDNTWLKTPPERPLAPADIQSAVEKLRKQFLDQFDPAYVENVIVPHFLVSVYGGERPPLPM